MLITIKYWKIISWIRGETGLEDVGSNGVKMEVGRAYSPEPLITDGLRV